MSDRENSDNGRNAAGEPSQLPLCPRPNIVNSTVYRPTEAVLFNLPQDYRQALCAVDAPITSNAIEDYCTKCAEAFLVTFNAPPCLWRRVPHHPSCIRHERPGYHDECHTLHSKYSDAYIEKFRQLIGAALQIQRLPRGRARAEAWGQYIRTRHQMGCAITVNRPADRPPPYMQDDPNGQ